MWKNVLTMPAFGQNSKLFVVFKAMYGEVNLCIFLPSWSKNMYFNDIIKT